MQALDSADSIIYGIGNVGREDDGLGWAFVDWIEKEGICPKAELVRSYQLHLEDADLIGRKKQILFVDASKKEEIAHFSISKVEPKLDFSFTSHAISVQSILATSKQCFEKIPEVYLMEIAGYEWELKIGLTQDAENNLNRSIEYFRTIVS
ncbi:MAG: hydrogenase maturation protease [Sulfurovum sp.]|nr:hydrogenase maturation protease [Sulfurovum sp.]